MKNNSEDMKKTRSLLVLLTGLTSLSSCLPLQYHLISAAVPWFKAQTYCRDKFTDLATVFDLEDVKRLVNTAEDSGGFTQKAWIGLHDDLTSWRWSGYYRYDENSYRNWDFNQPDNFLGDQMCVKMTGRGMWEDSNCFLKNPFVCYDGNAKARFIFIGQLMSWPDAQLYCRRQHTDLAPITEETENKQIQVLANNMAAWIGLYRTREWSDRSESAFRHWDVGQPDNFGGKQKCTATHLGHAGRWSDEGCRAELSFVCFEGETPRLSSTTASPEKRDSTRTELTSSAPEHVIRLRVKFTSTTQLSEDDIRELALVQFHKVLQEKGLHVRVKLELRKPQT